jgi:hypothetical protein
MKEEDSQPGVSKSCPKTFAQILFLRVQAGLKPCIMDIKIGKLRYSVSYFRVNHRSKVPLHYFLH